MATKHGCHAEPPPTVIPSLRGEARTGGGPGGKAKKKKKNLCLIS